MSEQIFNTRIIHKHDIEENWSKAVNFIPKQGELIVYDIDKNYNYERFKIGDGFSNVNDLPFAGTKLELDATLTMEGMAADAKAVGDAINDLSTDIAEAGSIDIDLDGSNEGETNPINADTLGGYSADTFIKNTDVIDADTLGNIPAEEYVKLSDLENIDIGVSVDLLWENANILDEFAEQNIPLNLGDYYKIEIVFEFHPAMTYDLPDKISSQNISTLHLVSEVGRISSYFTRFVGDTEIGRSFIYEKALNFLSIGNCITRAGDAYSNAFLVPYRIYGYKGGNV